MLNPIRKEFVYGNDTVVLETGRIARQATGAVLVTIGNTQVLATVVGKRKAAPDAGFFPLTVDYQEKTYAIGKIPGGFFKREGRPTEKETLTSRLIDRPIRPLFPKGFLNEVQVVTTVLSADKDVDSDIAAMIGASAALSISGIPFAGPLGAARVGYNDTDGYILNPRNSKLATSDLDMVVGGTQSAVLMVESEAKELSEDLMLGAVLFAHVEMQVVINAINEFKAMAGKPAWDWVSAAKNEALIAAVADAFKADLGAAYQISDKMARQDRVAQLQAEAVARLSSDTVAAGEVQNVFGSLEKKLVRGRIIEGKPRIDGRDNHTVRPINVQVGVLGRTHGSALFTRGETQALVVVRRAARCSGDRRLVWCEERQLHVPL